MKKLRLIPMISLAALLSGCSLFGGKAKAPSFSKEGEEVSYTEFMEKYQKSLDNSELADYDSKLGDRSLKASASYSESTVLKRGKKEVRKEERSYTIKGESQYDYDNLVAKATSETKSTQKATTQEGNGSTTETYKTEMYYQFTKIDGTKYLVSANAKTNVYSQYRPVMSGTDEDDVFDSYVRSNLSSSSYMFANYIPSSKEEAKDYLFYVNDDLFTIVYNDEDEDNSIKEYTDQTKTKIKVQIDLTDKKQAVRIVDEKKRERTYNKDYNGYLEDDVETYEEVTYADYSVSAKDVKVNEVNLDDYSLSGSGYYVY